MFRIIHQVAFGILLTGLPALAQSADDSKHRHGPHGLEGWTLNSTVPEHGSESYPMTLLIARHGVIIQRFEGDSFVWNWMFQSDGSQVAYESGPFHFGLTCVLADLRTGQRVADYDCFRELPADAPAWVVALEKWSSKPR